ncbi:MAG TPA: hypothetical protein VEU47_10390 [Candidatus Cybelea sp.]|nr:hypothetical protein [Candidatus Cybelea sp.]
MELLHDPELWVGAAFIGFVALLIYYKVPALATKALDDRAKHIQAEIEQAEKLHRDAQALFDEYSAKQRDALAEANEIVSRAKAEAERLAKQAATDLDAALARRRQLAESRIAQAEAQAVKEVRAAAVDLAISAAERIMASEVKGQTADSLIEQAIGDLKRKLH